MTAATVVAPGVWTSSGASRRGREADGPRLGAGDLHVGGVAGRQGDVVLARGAGRHELVGAGPAHHPDVGLDGVPLQPGPVEDPLVGPGVLLVAHLEPLGIAVERVRVLHDELARPQDAGARAGLVALLGLEVVEDLRQVAVGAHDLRDVHRHDLLVRHGQHHGRAAAVLELEELGPDRVVAAGLLPPLRRVEHGHQQLLAADGVHLLADDLHRLLVHPPAGGHPAPQAGADLADHAGADQQLVRERFRVGGRLLLGREDVRGESGHVRARSLKDEGRHTGRPSLHPSGSSPRASGAGATPGTPSARA